MKTTCKICGLLSGRQGFAAHLRSKHSIEQKEYYDTYFRKEHDEKCLVCNNETKFKNSFDGYFECCSMKCTAILKRKRLKDDPVKFENFTNKVKENMIDEWKKDQTERIAKSSSTIRENNKKLSYMERKKRFDVYMDYPEEEKLEIRRKFAEMGFLKWRKTASFDDITKVIEKTIKTKSEKRSKNFELSHEEELQTELFQKINKSLSSFFGLDPL